MHTGMPGTGWSPAVGQRKDGFHSGAESEPSSQPRLRLPPSHRALPSTSTTSKKAEVVPLSISEQNSREARAWRTRARSRVTPRRQAGGLHSCLTRARTEEKSNRANEIPERGQPASSVVTKMVPEETCRERQERGRGPQALLLHRGAGGAWVDFALPCMCDWLICG